MISKIINIITSLGTTPLELACLVYICEHLLFKPIMWVFKKYGGIIIK